MKKLRISKPFGCYRKFGINKKAQESRDNLMLFANTLNTMSSYFPYSTSTTMSTSNTANGWEFQLISSWAQNVNTEYNFRQGMKF